MNKIRQILLLLLAVIVCPNISKAQTSSVMTTVRTERELPNTKEYNPIKSVTIDSENGVIVSLAQYVGPHNEREHYGLPTGEDYYPSFSDASISTFMLTTEGGSIVLTANLQYVTITDFDYDERERIIYFCGVYKYLSYTFNVIGWFPVGNIGTAFSVNLYPIYTPTQNTTSYLKKIDFYRVYGTLEKRLSLIANDNDNTNAIVGSSTVSFPRSHFITYNLTNNTYHIEEISRVRLTDVVHTDSRVAVIGLRDFEHLVLFSHDQQDVNNYMGMIYNTYPLYALGAEVEYSIESLDNDFVCVGASLIPDDGDGRMEFTIFDLSSGINLIHTQAIMGNNDLECRSRISDMRYDREMSMLHILALNGCAVISGRDMIFQIRPFVTSPYGSYVSVPNKTMTGFNLMKSLTLYNDMDNRCYLVFGARANQLDADNGDTIPVGNLYFFDKKAYQYSFNDSHCERNYNFDIEISHSKYIPESIIYRKRYDLQNNPFPWSLYPTTISYQIICND